MVHVAAYNMHVAAVVTVQDFLNRYEIGATVGVGGIAVVRTRCCMLLINLVSIFSSSVSQAYSHAGFAVVKKGKDRKTGQPVAIKVSAGSCLLQSSLHKGPLCAMCDQLAAIRTGCRQVSVCNRR